VVVLAFVAYLLAVVVEEPVAFSFAAFLMDLAFLLVMAFHQVVAFHQFVVHPLVAVSGAVDSVGPGYNDHHLDDIPLCSGCCILLCFDNVVFLLDFSSCFSPGG